MDKNRKRMLALGAAMAFAGILIAASFQFVHDHRWYWNIAPFICLLVLLSAALGGLLVGYGLSENQHRRLWLAGLGSVLGLSWMGTGILAAGIAALGMYYLPSVEGHIGWDSYSSGNMLRSFNISFMQLATVTGVLGGFAVGFGLAGKRFWRWASAASSIG